MMQQASSAIRQSELISGERETSKPRGTAAPAPELGWTWRVPSGPHPMWIFEQPSGAIVAANDAALAAYGYTLDELLERCEQDICVPSEPGEPDLCAMTAEQAVWVGRFEQRRKDGRSFTADVAMVQTGDSVRPAMMVILDTDVDVGGDAANARSATVPTSHGDSPCATPRTSSHT